MKTATQKVMCGKCGGSGKLYHFGHIENGKCFDCAGSGRLDATRKACGFVAPRSAAEERQSFINKFNGALRLVAQEGKSALNEVDDAYTDAKRTEKDVLKSWLDSAKCPADVRERAVVAFAAVGVTF